MLFHYYAYGLGIQSDVPLPGFVAGNTGIDVVVRLQAPRPAPAEAGRGEWCYTFDSDTITMSQQRVGVLVIRAGSEINVIPTPDADMDLLPLYLIGTAMAWILWQRGLLPLHSSAVAINGRAALFLGTSGQGKSTTAAALHARGHAIIVDDIVPVDLSGNEPRASPGFPMLKLQPAAAADLGLNLSYLQPVHRMFDESFYIDPTDFPATPLPIGAIFTIEDGPHLQVEQLRQHEALFLIMREIYGVHRVGAHFGAAHYFQRCSRLAAAVPIYRIQRTRGFAHLPALAQLIEELVCPASVAA